MHLRPGDRQRGLRRAADADEPLKPGRAIRWRVALAQLLLFALIMPSAGAHPAGASAVELARITRPAPVSAYGGWVAWSAYDASVQRYRLMVWHAGTVRTPPIGAASQPFNVDLGPDASGRPVAVFSRCPPRGTSAGSCDIDLLDLTTGHERRTKAAADPAFDETAPSIWRDILVFARAKRRSPSNPQMRFARAPTAHTHAIAGLKLPRGAGGPDRLDLYGHQLIMRWGSTREDCVDSEQSADTPGEQLWLSNLRTSRSSLLNSACLTDPRLLLQSPSLGPAGVTAIEIDRRQAPAGSLVPFGVAQFLPVSPVDPHSIGPENCPTSVSVDATGGTVTEAPVAGCASSTDGDEFVIERSN